MHLKEISLEWKVRIQGEDTVFSLSSSFLLPGLSAFTCCFIVILLKLRLLQSCAISAIDHILGEISRHRYSVIYHILEIHTHTHS